MASATLYLTNKCNLRCQHCFVGSDQLRDRTFLSTDEVKTTLKRMKDGGVDAVTLLGGEVTTRPDLESILLFCDLLQLKVSINTNLIDVPELMTIAAHESVFNLVVSLDGLRPESHDAIRGRGSFERTMRNLARLTQHPRSMDGTLTIDMTFVLTKKNVADALALPQFYKIHRFTKLNVKTMQFNDRAETNRASLELSPKELLNTLTAVYVLCLQVGDIDLDMYIPPLFGAYLNQIAASPERLWNYEACGGQSVYTYVDMYGNNMPCPAMSLEENRESKFSTRLPGLNLIDHDLQDVQSSALFDWFENSRAAHTRNSRMEPCNRCAFSDRCSPCTNEIIRGKAVGVVDICQAIFDHADERVDGFTRQYFSPSIACAAATL